MPATARWAWIGAALIAIGVVLNLPVGVLLLLDGATWRGLGQLAVAFVLVRAGLGMRRRAALRSSSA